MRSNTSIQINALNATSKTSSPIDSNQLYGISVQCYATDGTAAGTVKLQASNDPSPLLNSGNASNPPTNWTDIPNASADMAAAGSALIPYTQICYRWVRIVYTQTTPGSGNIVCQMTIQSV